jgi:predicted O-methyltransferase YrrM
MRFFAFNLTGRHLALLVLSSVVCGILVGVAAQYLAAPVALGLAVALSVATLGILVVGLSNRNSWRVRQIEAGLALSNALNGPQVWWHAAPYSSKPDFVLAILRAIEEQAPQTIVELGSGLSTVVVASIIHERGLMSEFVSIDHDAEYARRTWRQLQRFSLSQYVRLVLAPLVPYQGNSRVRLWYDVSRVRAAVNKVDLLVVDGPPAHVSSRVREPALEVFAPLLTPGALVLLDDAKRFGERSILRKWRRDFPRATVTLQDAESGVGRVMWPR